MFEIGDYIIYGNNGICSVVEIGPINLGGPMNKDEKLYYTLEPVYEMGSKFYTPVGNEKVLMRKAMSKEEALELIENIPDIGFDPDLTDKEREAKIKDALIKSIDPEEWIKVVKALYYRKEERKLDGKKMTSTDEKFLNEAEEFLFGEIAISLDKSREEVEDLVLNRIKEANIA